MAISEPRPDVTMLDPERIAAQRFMVAKRGYEIEEVGSYLRSLAQAVTRMLGEIDWLRARTDHLERRSGSEQEAAYARLAKDFAATIKAADEAARRSLEEAETEARDTVARATERADTAVSAAEQEAASILERARVEAEALLTRAQVEAEEVIASVRRQAAAIEPPSARDLWARVWDGGAQPATEQQPSQTGTNGWHGPDVPTVAHDPWQDFAPAAPAPGQAGDIWTLDAAPNGASENSSAPVTEPEPSPAIEPAPVMEPEPTMESGPAAMFAPETVAEPEAAPSAESADEPGVTVWPSIALETPSVPDRAQEPAAEDFDLDLGIDQSLFQLFDDFGDA